MTTKTNRRPRSVCVLGGGTSGYFVALALKQRFPEMAVTVIESSKIPIIGVGEATTTLMPPFLHAQLGLDPVELWRAVRPTFKLGIKFEWGLPGDYYFTYPFGVAHPLEAYAHERDIRSQSLVSMLMSRDAGPVIRDEAGALRSLLPSQKVAYHLDNAPFVTYLAAAARARGIEHRDLTIDRIVPRDDGPGIASIGTADGVSLSFDLYVDASGFRSQLIGQTLGSPFQSFASTLFCDRAIVATVPQPEGVVRPYTTAETMDAGWCWRIPVEGEDHRGYVHSSAHLDEGAAVDEMRAKNPGMGEPWVVRFRSGRHRDFWLGNVVSVGNAYGFVEPLESTALHMVIIEIAYIIAGIEAAADPDDDGSFAAFASDAVGKHWDYLRWFLGVHYRFNRRLDTRFWREVREGVDVSGLAQALSRFEAEGPWSEAEGKRYGVGDPAFGYSGLMIMLLGQQAATRAPPKGELSAEAWASRRASLEAEASRALTQQQALDALHANPSMLEAFARDPSSWVQGSAERAQVNPRQRGPVHPRSG